MWSDEKRVRFLASLSQGNSTLRAATDAGISRSVAYVWRHKEPDFAAAWDDAVEAGTDELEDVAIQRAKEGSDTLLIFMLKARRPEKYKERFQADIRNAVTVTFETWLERLHPHVQELLVNELELLPATAIPDIGETEGSA